MYQRYARGELKELAVYLNRAIKFLGMVLALIVGLVCGFAKPLLQLWLGPAFEGMAPLLCLMTIPICLTLCMYPLYAVPLAANRVKVPGLVTLAVGVLNLALALLFAKVFGWGLYGIAAAGGISRTLRNFVFTPIYGAHVLQRSYRTFYGMVIPIIRTVLITIGSCRLVMWGWTLSNWVDLGVAAMAVSMLVVAMIYLLLTFEERMALKDAVVQWRQ
jgi:membrane protein EpsK